MKKFTSFNLKRDVRKFVSPKLTLLQRQASKEPFHPVNIAFCKRCEAVNTLEIHAGNFTVCKSCGYSL